MARGDRGFNEAGAIEPRKPNPTCAAVGVPRRFNEAGAIEPRKLVEVDMSNGATALQ